MKKYAGLTILTVLMLALGSVKSVQAEIIPPYGEGEKGFQAVVLCDSLTVRRERSSSAKAVKTLRYGDTLAVQKPVDGWADCCLSDTVDASRAGWVNADYIMIDPAWCRTEKNTSVYAWNDTSAPKVALLSKNTTLPILKEDGEWLIVSLRGATGWIRRSDVE